MDMISVFVSYRRDDSRHQAGRLYDHLVEQFGKENVFKDVSSIPLGLDFREVLTERVADCDVFLAVIGDEWLSIAGKSGIRRLDDPGDFVRIELEAALSRKIPVIPVLVGNSSVPQAEELPESLRGLSFRQGLLVRPDPDFHNDMDRLIRGIEDVVSALRERLTPRGPKTHRQEAQKSADKKSSIDPRAEPPGVHSGHREEPKAESARKHPETRTPPPISPTRTDGRGSSTVGAEAAGSPNGRIWRVGLAGLAVVAAVIVISQLGPPRDGTPTALDGTAPAFAPRQVESTPSVKPAVRSEKARELSKEQLELGGTPGAVKPEVLPKPQPKVPDEPPKSIGLEYPGSPGSVKRQPTSPGEPSKLIANSIGVKLVLIPAGEFLMGSPDSDTDASPDEKPQHQVRITRPFYLGATELTQGQYRGVTGETPSLFKGSDDLPVEQVSWNDAIAFCNKLSEREGLMPYYQFGAGVQSGGDGYRLPTEAEWEYACRAGTSTRYCFGDDVASLGEYAWFQQDKSSVPRTHPVGQKRPNKFGLYDMHGNLWEWCWDGYDKDYYRQSPVVDAISPLRASGRVIRGGSWGVFSRRARSATRDGSAPENGGSLLGFRVARGQSGR
jgi:formylglycine-generating enzyme required for sulfatase activity